MRALGFLAEVEHGGGGTAHGFEKNLGDLAEFNRGRLVTAKLNIETDRREMLFAFDNAEDRDEFITCAEGVPEVDELKATISAAENLQ